MLEFLGYQLQLNPLVELLTGHHLHPVPVEHWRSASVGGWGYEYDFRIQDGLVICEGIGGLDISDAVIIYALPNGVVVGICSSAHEFHTDAGSHPGCITTTALRAGYGFQAYLQFVPSYLQLLRFD